MGGVKKKGGWGGGGGGGFFMITIKAMFLTFVKSKK